MTRWRATGLLRFHTASLARLKNHRKLQMEQRQFRAPEAADYLGLSTSTLAKMRIRGDGPVYAKVGPRVVVYDRADLDSWLSENKRRSTSE